ncbi:MAG TPA: non-canonical purine NTP pyrophosphatase, partial [Streptomyces sp.]|nr:non-canonical purine NTP pyrophosphatase [Streptomyces sp.]
MSTSKRLILATRNAHKVRELRAILAEAGVSADLVGADSYPHIPDVKETGVSFAENALLKAHALALPDGTERVVEGRLSGVL